MTRLIAYRGPDGEGFYFDNNVGLGHRRLVVIDPVGGRQPLCNEDGTIWACCNGEIYNYLEVREFLRARGHRLSTRSDTEVIVHLFEEYGPRFVERMNGMFAIALWDRKDRTLYLYRDRLGVKPLYYAETNGGVTFASEIKALLLDRELSREINPQSLYDLLTYGYVPPPNTLFQGVKSLAPGHFAVCKAAGIALQKYWDLPLEVDDTKPEEEYATELLELLSDATRLRLRSDVPLGAFLSGGLDSSTVVALASNHLSQPLLTFSVGFKEEGFSELPFARQVSAAFATKSRELVVEADLTSLLPHVIWHCDQPHGDSSFLALYAMSQFASRHARVILNGDGGDEFLGGYEQYAAFPNRELPPRTDLVGAYYRSDYVSVFSDAEKAQVLSPEFASSHRLQSSERILRDLFQQAAGLDFRAGMLYADQKLLLPGNNLIKSDRMGSPQPVELRSPFLDYRVAELTARMPFRYKVGRYGPKHILKKAVEGLLPAEIVHRKKQMFAVPIGEWFRAGAKECIRDILYDGRFVNRGVFDATRVQQMLEEHQAGCANYGRQLRLILNIELWFRIFMDRTLLAEPTDLAEGMSARFQRQVPRNAAGVAVG